MNGAGFLEIWRDGVHIVDYHGTVGTDPGTRSIEIGRVSRLARGCHARWRSITSNITSTDPNFPLPSSSSAAVPVIMSFSTDSGTVGGDGYQRQSPRTLDRHGGGPARR